MNVLLFLLRICSEVSLKNVSQKVWLLFGAFGMRDTAYKIFQNWLLICKLLTWRAHIKWVPELQRYIRKYNEEHGTSKVPPIVLVGNEVDVWDKTKVPESAVSRMKTQPTELSSLLTRIALHVQIKSVVDGCEMIKSYTLCSDRNFDGSVEDTFQEACRVALANMKPKKKGCCILWVHLWLPNNPTYDKETIQIEIKFILL